MKKIRYHKCSKCNNKAVWYYMPSGHGRNFYCDEHVPRGCTCNVYSIEEFGDNPLSENVIYYTKEAYENHNLSEGTTKREKDSFYYEVLDEKGRRLPCCEFDYDEDGFEVENDTFYVKIDTIKSFMNRYGIRHLTVSTFAEKQLRNKINEYIESVSGNQEIEYNTFIRNMYDVIYPYMHRFSAANDNAYHFYNSLKSMLSQTKYRKEIDCNG